MGSEQKNMMNEAIIPVVAVPRRGGGDRAVMAESTVKCHWISHAGMTFMVFDSNSQCVPFSLAEAEGSQVVPEDDYVDKLIIRPLPEECCGSDMIQTTTGACVVISDGQTYPGYAIYNRDNREVIISHTSIHRFFRNHSGFHPFSLTLLGGASPYDPHCEVEWFDCDKKGEFPPK